MGKVRSVRLVRARLVRVRLGRISKGWDRVS